MALDTYADLVAAVGSWLNRADLADVVPQCVTLAEASVRRTLRVRTIGPQTFGTIDALTPTLTLPAECQEVRDLAIVDPFSFAIGIVSPAQLIDRRGKYQNANGVPMIAAVAGTQVRFSPTPDRAYVVNIAYFQKLPDLTAAAPTNWLLSSAPDVYLYGVLMHMAPYLMEDERIGVWSSAFNKALLELERQRDMDEYGAGPLTITSQVSF